MPRRSLFLLAALALGAALVGCGHNPPAGPPVATPYPLQGQITLAENVPLRGGVITFTPKELKTGSKIRYEAAGLVDAPGNYKIGRNGDGSGAPAGDYTVTIQPREYQELPNSNSNRIPAKFREPSTTPLIVTVKEEPNTFNFELK